MYAVQMLGMYAGVYYGHLMGPCPTQAKFPPIIRYLYYCVPPAPQGFPVRKHYINTAPNRNLVANRFCMRKNTFAVKGGL